MFLVLVMTGHAEEIVPTNDLMITKTVKLKPGVYVVEDTGQPGILRMEGEGITVDATGVTLRGAELGTPADKMKGVGVWVKGKNITIKGGYFPGFHIGIN